MLPEEYAYLILSGLYVTAWTVVLIKSAFKRGMIKVRAVGGLMGVLAEVWYFRDYWRPPTLFGQSIPGIEDYIRIYNDQNSETEVLDKIREKYVQEIGKFIRNRE